MKSKLWIICFALAVLSARDIYAAPAVGAEGEAKINALISKMTLQEKVLMVAGDDPHTHGIKRLGIPSFDMSDGPLGVRRGHSTAFPAGLALGASFDPSLASQMGSAIAEEARAKGISMMLGPCVEIAREPFSGRNFESYGEDPLLNSLLGANYIRGMQSKNVIATVKHFVANDQEFHRMTSSSDVDVRTLFEIHLPMFKAAVDAGVWSVMSSYNRVNGTYASESPDLINHVLKSMWGFKGFVVSDWSATHSTVASANAGLDLEMPSGTYFGAHLVRAVQSGAVKMSLLDDKVRRLLRAMNSIGLLEPKAKSSVNSANKSLGPESRAHQLIAQKIAEESIVLLKNENQVLPLKVSSIAVIGPHAAILRTGGGGSSKVIPFQAVSPLDSLKLELGSSIKINYAEGATIAGDVGAPLTSKQFKNGLKASYFHSRSLSGTPFLKRSESALELSSDTQLDDRFGVRFTGDLVAPLTGTYVFSVANSHTTRVFIDGKRILSVEASSDTHVQQMNVKMVDGHTYSFALESGRGDDDTEVSLQMGWKLPDDHRIETAVAAAKNSDVAILFLGMGNEMEAEGADRDSLALPDDQLALLDAVTKANSKTIVVLTGGGVITMPWLSKVKAVVYAWYPGQEGGHAIARVLSGAVNPSGKLPISFIKDWKDSSAYGPPSAGYYPGVRDHTLYHEGVFVGYRFLDNTGKAPAFPFGFGLSYSTFSISNLQTTLIDSSTAAAHVKVKFDVTNTGAQAGDEVAQVYVGETNPSLPRPPRELKAFSRVSLNPGQTQTIELELPRSAFAFFDVPSMSWKVNSHVFTISVGSSSRDLALHSSVQLR